MTRLNWYAVFTTIGDEKKSPGTESNKGIVRSFSLQPTLIIRDNFNTIGCDKQKQRETRKFPSVFCCLHSEAIRPHTVRAIRQDVLKIRITARKLRESRIPRFRNVENTYRVPQASLEQCFGTMHATRIRIFVRERSCHSTDSRKSLAPRRHWIFAHRSHTRSLEACHFTTALNRYVHVTRDAIPPRARQSALKLIPI